ncbi:AraC family transcriptional regulator [Rhodopila sp.]|uniref:AraC family transcriptional regulator n=1 Tax=Rhodopila sp. TaxID=2480087 RepID=UPI003D128840
MSPDLEIVDVRQDESFKVWSHGYPYRTVRWHFHPEYEIHLITETRGRSFVGDYIGSFEPGNLVMTGPNLPHNWISDIPPATVVERRCLVLQFTAELAASLTTFPELRFVHELLTEAGCGIEFAADTATAAQPLLTRLLVAAGAARITLFISLLDVLHRCKGRRRLASLGYQPTPVAYMSEPLNHVLAHIARNLGSDLRESELAQLSGYGPSAFSRAFKRHTGIAFVQYVNQLRVNRACELLMHDDMRMTDICFQVGFNNLSNFNRQFLAQKHMPPSLFRIKHRANGCIAVSPP